VFGITDPLFGIAVFLPTKSDIKKSNLIEDLAAAVEVTKPQAGIIVDCLVELIQIGMRKNAHFPMSGLRTLAVRKGAARTDRNPATCENLKIKAIDTAKFRAATDLGSR
jgi:DNA-binding protein HU-beta